MKVYFYGWYAEALYFLTGEHRDYERKTGVLGRVVPHENFGEAGALGGFQLGARYNQLCLVDPGLNGGRLQDVTPGLNWLLNPNMKIQTNYTLTIRDTVLNPDGASYDGVGKRLAWDFQAWSSEPNLSGKVAACSNIAGGLVAAGDTEMCRALIRVNALGFALME